MRNNYQRRGHKSNHKFEVVGGQELLVRVPLPMAEVWAEMQAQVEELTGKAGLQILRAILENEVTHRVGPPHRPNPTGGCVHWGKQSGYVVFGGQKIPLERPRVRTREGEEVELESYGWHLPRKQSRLLHEVEEPAFPDQAVEITGGVSTDLLVLKVDPIPDSCRPVVHVKCAGFSGSPEPFRF